MPASDNPTDVEVNGSETKLMNDSMEANMTLESAQQSEVSHSDSKGQTELVQQEGIYPSKSMDMSNEIEMLTSANHYETLDDTYFVSAITRLIESPEPLIQKEQFMFVNIENTEDDNELSFEVFSITKEPEDITATPHIPYLRPDSPNAVSEPTPTPEEPTEDTPEDATQVIEAPVEILLEKNIDREEYIAKIKMGLVKKDRLKSKNLNLQGKLVEYFRRKRVLNF